MNRTTVKRGIGAVILALIAAALLAFLLKDKAAQRQEVVEIALPGSGGDSATTDQTTRLPTLTTDNSGNGSVIANAGSGSGSSTSGNGNAAASGSASSGSSSTGSNSTASSGSADGAVIASAAAVGAAATGAASTAANSASNGMDFSVKPKVSKASSEFLDLDLVNNGKSASGTPAAAATPAPTATSQAAEPVTQTAVTSQPAASSGADQGVVIASTKPRASNTVSSAPQPRLIDERRSTPVKSSSTASVVTKQAPASKAVSSTGSSDASAQAKNGYAIQLLATSSASRANNLKKVMAGEGYPTYVTKTKQNGKTLYRVRIGQYAAKAQAAKAHAAMKRRYKKNANVNRSAIVAR